MSDSTLYLCPFCGAFINEEAEVCPNCSKPLEEEVEGGFEKELDDLIDEDLNAMSGSESCPRCGKQLEEGSLECLDCNMKIEDGLEPASEGEEEGVALFLCSGCGAFINSNSNECPKCGISLDDEAEEEHDFVEYDNELLDLLVENEPDEEDELILELDSIDDPEDLISVIDKMPDIEDEELFDDEPDIVLDLDLADDDPEGDLLHMNIDDEIEKTRIVESISERVAGEVAIESDSGDEIMLCGECGAFVSQSSKECNVCGNDIRPGSHLAIEKDEIPSENDGENTETALRSILGILDDVILDPDPMADHEDDIGICQKCGAFIPHGESACPVCHADKKSLPDIIYTELPIDDHDSMSICGDCGAFVKSDSDTCNVCGAKVDADMLRSIEPDDVLEMGMDADDPMDILKKALGVLELRDTTPEERIGGELDLCPDCGAFVSANAKSCSICGSDLIQGTDISLDDGIVMDLDDGSVILSDSVCPNCGSKFGVGAGDCEVCGFTFLGDESDHDEKEMSYEDRVDISDIIEFEVPELTKESAIDHLNEMEDDMDDLILDEVKPESSAEVKSGELSNEEKLARIEKAYEEGQLSKANYIINKAKFYGLVQEMNEIEDDLDELLIDIDETMAETVEVPTEEDEIESLELGDLHLNIDPDAQDDEDTQPDVEMEYDDLSLSEDDIKEGIHDGKYDDIIEFDDQDLDLTQDDTYQEDLDEHIETYEEEDETSKEDETSDEDVIYEEVEVYVDEDGQEIEYEEVEVNEDDIEEYEEDVDDPEGTDLDDHDPEETYFEEEDEIHVPFRSHAMAETTGGPQYLNHSGWEYGVIASLLTSLFYVALSSYIPINPISLAIIFGVILIFAFIMMVTSRSIFMKGDLYRGSVFMIGGVIISFILLHWFADIMIDDPMVDKMLLSIGIMMIGIGIIWIRGKIRYIHLWLSGTIFLFLFSIGELYYFEQWAYSPIQPPGAIVAGIGISLIVASSILLAYERSLHTSIETEIVRGDMDYLNKNYKKALHSYDRALEKSTLKTESALKADDTREYDVPWYSKGATLILMGNLKEGIECLDMALSINPNNEVAWVSKGNAYSKLGDMSSALESYNNALIANPRYIIAWNNRGNAFARKENYIEALKNYNRAIKLDPDYKDAWINKGYVLMKMGKQDEALKCVSMIGEKKMGQHGAASTNGSTKASA